MLIEDDKTMLALLSTLLKMEGFQIVTLTTEQSVEALLDTLRHEKPDAALVDVHLHQASGIAGVRPACPVDPLPLPVTEAGQRGLQDPLDRPAPGLTWKPAKSVPSYSTGRGNAGRRPLGRLRQTSSIWTISAASPRRWPSRTIRVYPDVRSAYLGAISSNSFATTSGSFGNWATTARRAVEVAALGERDHLLDAAADLLGLRLGRLDPLVAEDRHGQVLEQAQPRSLLAAELAAADPMGHRSALRLVVERLVGLGRPSTPSAPSRGR